MVPSPLYDPQAFLGAFDVAAAARLTIEVAALRRMARWSLHEAEERYGVASTVATRLREVAAESVALEEARGRGL